MGTKNSIIRSCTFALAVTFVAVGAGAAQNLSEGSPRTDPIESTQDEDTPVQAIPGLTISGFVDASYFGHNLAGVGNSFGLDQVEIDISREMNGRGAIRADLEWVSDGAGGFALDVEQGFVTFDLSEGGPFTLTFGKFNAPIGFELLDAPDMYQFSHALVFDYGLPTNLTGAMLSAETAGGTTISMYVANGWDQNVDTNSGKTVGARVGLALTNQISMGISGIVDRGDPGEGEEIRVLDIDLTANASEALVFGGEFNRGTSSFGEATSRWTGFMAMGHLDFDDRHGLTVRFDHFDDESGARLGGGRAEVRKAFTIAPTLALGGGMGMLLEIRRETSSLLAFINENGAPSRSWLGVALEMTYSF